MSQPQFHPLSLTCLLAAALAAAPAVSMALPEAAQTANAEATKLPPVTKQPSSLKASAYYHFSLGHLYEELAGNNGNRSDYVNKAIDNFRLAIKEDPSASFLIEDIAELYRMSGRIREAVEEAQEALKTNPDDLNARRVLARIYTQQIGDAQANRIDEGMAHRAIDQYKVITQKDPKDVESLVMMGRLDRVVNDSVSGEAAFKQAISIEPDNEDAIVGLASVYSDRGDVKGSSKLLEQLSQKNPSPRALVILANNYESMHEYSLAADAYKKALDLDPNRAELKSGLAQDLTQAERFDEALKMYQELTEANPQDAQPYSGMAQVYRAEKKFPEARQMIDKAKALDPDNVEIRYYEVGLLEEEGKTPEAIAALKDLLDATTHPTYDQQQKGVRTQMLEQLASLYAANEQYPKAIETYRQMAALDPDLTPKVEASVADTYRASKDYAKSQQTLDAALKKYPNDRTLAEVHAQLLSDEGKTDQAVAELRKLMDGKNDRKVDLAIADVYQKAKNFGEMAKAVDAADKLSQTKDDKTQVLFVRGEMLERQKKYDQAERVFRQVIDADPSNASAMNYLGYMLADQNLRLPEAQDLIKKAVNLDPNNYAFLDSLGWVYFRLNKLDDAEQQLNKSLQLMSKDPTIHDHLGDVYFKAGKIREAITQWESSLKQFNTGSAADAEPDEISKVQKKLDSARVRLAKEQGPRQN